MDDGVENITMEMYGGYGGVSVGIERRKQMRYSVWKGSYIFHSQYSCRC
jgi:hypothetical protein